jgi:outer membrane protein
MNHKHTSLAIATALGLACGIAQAQSQDNVVKIGGTLYQPHSSTNGISGIGVPAGADASVDNATTVIFVYERLVTPNIGVEFVLGIPPTIKARATGTVSFLGDDVLSAKNLAPTLLVNYHFGSPGDMFRPYLGAGINYTKFTDAKSVLASDVKLGDSYGLAVQAGVNYAINKDWGLFASIAKIDVKSKLVASGSTVLTTTIDFKPLVYSIGGYWQF